MILVVARLDSAALFHDRAVGAGSDLSGLLHLLAAADLLQRWGVGGGDAAAAGAPAARRLACAALGGEDWGYLGSRQLVRALRAGDAALGGVTLDQVEMVVELGALGLVQRGDVSDDSDDCGDSPKYGEVVRIECTVSAVDSSGFYW